MGATIRKPSNDNLSSIHNSNSDESKTKLDSAPKDTAETVTKSSNSKAINRQKSDTTNKSHSLKKGGKENTVGKHGQNKEKLKVQEARCMYLDQAIIYKNENYLI